MTPGTCTEDGCSVKRYSRGLCYSHYGKAKQSGALPPPLTPKAQVKACDAAGCDKVARPAKRWCSMHDTRLQRHGSLDLPVKARPVKLCVAPDCGRKANGRYCPTHAARMRKHGTLEPRPCRTPKCRNTASIGEQCARCYRKSYRAGEVGTPCAVPSCAGADFAKRLCHAHYLALQRSEWAGIAAKEIGPDILLSLQE